MRKSVLRGGNDDYKISEVLGPKFQQVVTVLKNGNGSLDPFLYANAKDNLTSSQDRPEPTDLWFELPEFLIAAAAAFREIEIPETSRMKIGSTYIGAVDIAFDELINEKYSSFADPGKAALAFKQLPFEYNNNEIKHLVPGLNLLPYNGSFYYNPTGTTHNALINAIRYLHNYIALLDTSNLNARDVINFLKQDRVYFMRYVNEIIDVITSTDILSKNTGLPTGSADSRQITTDGVLIGLTAVAQKIIDKYNNISAAPGPITTPAIDFTDQAKIEDYLVKIGVDKKLFDELKKFVDLDEQGANVGALGLDPVILKKYLVDSLMNPEYILDANVMPTVTQANFDVYSKPTSGAPAAPVAPVGAVAGPGSGMAAVVDPGKVPALDYLYGPTININIPAADPDNGKRNITPEDKQGTQNNANLVELKNVQTVQDFVKAFAADTTAPNKKGIAAVQLVTLLYYLIVNNKNLDPSLDKAAIANDIKTH